MKSRARALATRQRALASNRTSRMKDQDTCRHQRRRRHALPIVIVTALPLLLLLLAKAQAFQQWVAPTSLAAGYHCVPSSKPITASRSKSMTRCQPFQSRSLALRAWPKNKDPKSFARDYPRAAARVGATVLAALLTYAAHANQRCGPVLASAAVTLAGSLIAPGLGQAAMCGSFTGMSSVALLPSVSWALGAGVLTSVLFEALIHTYDAALGLGGRLGATAFLAVNAVALMQGIAGVPTSSLALPAITSNLASFVKPATVLPSSPVAVTVGFTALGALATIALREASDDKPAADPVRAAAVIGMLGALAVGICGYTELASLSTYGGAFVGMSLPSRLMRGVVPGKRPRRDPPATAAATTVGGILAAFALAGVLGGLVHGLTIHLGWFVTPAGWGGKAGFCSFVGVGLFRAGERLVKWVRRGRGGGLRARWPQTN